MYLSNIGIKFIGILKSHNANRFPTANHGISYCPVSTRIFIFLPPSHPFSSISTIISSLFMYALFNITIPCLSFKIKSFHFLLQCTPVCFTNLSKRRLHPSFMHNKRGLLCRKPLLHHTGRSEWGTQPSFRYFQGNALKSFDGPYRIGVWRLSLFWMPCFSA